MSALQRKSTDRRSRRSSLPEGQDPIEGKKRGGPEKRRGLRLVVLVAVGVLMVAASWGVRSSRWATGNVLRTMSLPELEVTVRHHPDDFDARYELAKRYYLAQRFADAGTAYGETVRIDPRSARAHLGLGLSLMEQGEPVAAKSEFESALRYDPNLAWAEYMLGKIAWQRGDVNTALQHARRATELDPRSHPAWYVQAICYITLQRFDEGIEALRQALAREDNSARYHTAMGELLVYRGQTDKGRHHYERALQIDPDYGPVCALMGSLYLRKIAGAESLPRAKELLERASKLKTYHPNQVYFDLGELYLQEGEYRKAAEALKESIRLDARDERPYYSLAKTYRRLGDKKAAVEAEQTFRTISNNHVEMQMQEARVFHNPNSGEARLKLARTYRRLGLAQQAAQQYAIYLRINPNDSAIAAELGDVVAKAQATSPTVERPDYFLPPVK
jgi:tetratricopeptide (TPR) repeat protein